MADAPCVRGCLSAVSALPLVNSTKKIARQALCARTTLTHIRSDASRPLAEARHQHGALACAHGETGVRHAAGEEESGARRRAEHERGRRASRGALVGAARPEACATALEGARW